ncbi:uncharacterized protein LOC135502935 [Lineus longissimus]|uniref:uncharacterized protein LOC135502935 n=1 Tax=Lineus longissimus TaxID=88925 RepID=UPI00315CF224
MRHPATGGGGRQPPPTDAEEAYYTMREGDPSIKGLISGFDSEIAWTAVTQDEHKNVVFDFRLPLQSADAETSAGGIAAVLPSSTITSMSSKPSAARGSAPLEPRSTCKRVAGSASCPSTNIDKNMNKAELANLLKASVKPPKPKRSKEDLENLSYEVMQEEKLAAQQQQKLIDCQIALVGLKTDYIKLKMAKLHKD